MFKKILALVLLLVVPAFAYAGDEEKTSKTWTIGPWEMGEYKSKETGAFSHCTMSVIFTAPNKKVAEIMKTQDLILMLKVNYDTSFNFILLGSNWNLNMGKKYTVDTRYSTGKVYHIDATAVGDKKASGLDVNFPANGKWTENFMEAEWIELFIEGKPLGSFYLKGSRNAMTSMLNCYAANTPTVEEPPFGEGR